MRFFIAGIMQGSHLGGLFHHQGYRSGLKELLAEHFPDAEIYDPLADHENSLDYTDAQARSVFLRHNQMCGEVDVVIAFVPEASMGTAIEMWEAQRHGKIVLTISPLAHNWVIRFCSHQVFSDLDAFASALRDGDLHRRLECDWSLTPAKNDCVRGTGTDE